MSKKRTSVRTSQQAKAQPSSSSPMNIGLLEEIVKLMASNDLNTVDVRDGDKRVILRRGAALAPTPVAVPLPVAAAAPAAAPAPVAEKAPEEAGYLAIKSPMVGTFYASPSPDAKPFVSVGSAVTEDTDVCIIEAMKVFNNIKAECRGTIAKILVSNGQTIEFGQTLFLVKP